MEQDVRDVIAQIAVSNYFSLAPSVILYYDFLLTFDDEVRFFWRRKWNSVTMLFFLNRYFPLVGHVPGIVKVLATTWSPKKIKGCRDVQLYHQLYLVAGQLIVGSILIIRTYALYGRSRKILSLLVAILIVGGAVAAWALAGPTSAPGVPADELPPGSCQSPLTQKAGILIATPWEAVLVLDTVVFVLTLYKAIEVWKSGPSTLFEVLVRDGTIYFFVLELANLSNILTLSLGHIPSIYRGLTTTFANVVSVVMISRLMLNIQNPALFGTHRSQTGTGYTTDCNVGPFVATRGSGHRRGRFTSFVFSSAPESYGSMAKKPTWHPQSTFNGSQRTWTTDTSTDIELNELSSGSYVSGIR